MRFLIGVNAHLSGIAPFINPQKELSIVPLHSDVNLPTPLPESPFMATACWILDDVNDLYVIPGSHRFGHNPGTAGAVAPDLPEIVLSVKAGSLAVWHGHLWYGVKAGAARKLNILALPVCPAIYVPRCRNGRPRKVIIRSGRPSFLN